MTGFTIRLRAGLAALTLVGGFAALAVAAAPASAAGTARYVATDGSDGNGDNIINDCTVQASPCATVGHAVDEADPGDTINIAAGSYHESVDIRKSVTLQGAGSSGTGKTIIDGDPKSGDASVFVDGRDVNTTTVVTIKDVAVDGNSDNDGIQVQGDATLHLIDSSSSNNDRDGVNATPPQALEKANAAVPPSPTITISGSSLSGNARSGLEADNTPITVDHSSVSNNARFGFAVILGTMQVSTSTFDGNSGAGIAFEGGSLTLDTSTVSNTKQLPSDGPTFGAGVLNFAGSADITNSTLAGNDGYGVLSESGQTTVTTSTISGTHVGSGGLKGAPSGGLVMTAAQNARATASIRKQTGFDPAALRSLKKAPAAPSLSVVGSIVAEQDTDVPDCVGEVTNGGYNLSSDAGNSCKFSAAKHDQISTDPLLGPLADNGGPTMTEILKKLSPAIDAIPAGQANCSSSAADQRGIARPQPTGGKCDVGAVEVAAKKLAIHPDSLPKGKVGKAYHATITATGGQYPIYTFAFVSGTLPDGLALNSHGKITGTPTKAGTFHFTVSVNDPVFKDYTIVITDEGSGTEPVSNTGVPTGSLLAVGGGAVVAGVLLLLWVGVFDRRARGPRIVYGRHLKK